MVTNGRRPGARLPPPSRWLSRLLQTERAAAGATRPDESPRRLPARGDGWRTALSIWAEDDVAGNQASSALIASDVKSHGR